MASIGRAFAWLASTSLVWFCGGAGAQESAGGAHPSLPQGGNVVSGAASLDYSSPLSLTVNQTTASSIINWNTFDIAAAHTVYFNQPSASSATLNRVASDAPSVLAGRLSAPGTVLLVNPNGIAITEGAIINTGSFAASALDIADADFLTGRFTFRNNGRAGVVSNNGRIEVSSGGAAALIGAGVVNEGVVEARLGRVAFGAGDLVTLDFSGEGFLSVGVPVSELADLTDASGAPLGALVTAGGVVRADGGSIYISAARAQDMMLRAVNVPGELIARSVSRNAQGHIVLDAREGAVAITGALDVSGDGDAGGGQIDVRAAHVAVGGALLADGAEGGVINVAASQDLLLAGSVSAQGRDGAGGAVRYNAGRDIVEVSGSFTNVSGATDGGAISVIGGGDVLSSGRHFARGLGGAGGRIDVTGETVTLLSMVLDASAAQRGGLVRVGGGFQGGGAARFESAFYNGFEGRFGGAPGLAAANTVFVNDGVDIDVSSAFGVGGTALVWSQSQTTMLGSLDARGAAGGGFAEISSADTLRTIDLARVTLGRGGELLLDPKNIVIGDFVAAQTWQQAAIVGNGVGGAPNVDIPLGAGDGFGAAVALNAAGDRLAIGSFLDDGFGDVAQDTGAVRLFTFTDGNFSGGALSGIIGAGYVGAGNFDVSTLNDRDYFGRAMAFNADGDRLAVGARRDDGAGNTTLNTGAVYLFTFSDLNFGGAALASRIGVGYEIDVTANLDNEDFFGHALALNAAGDRLAVGAYQDDGAGNGFVDSGAVHLFTFTDGDFGGGAYAGAIGRGYSGGQSFDVGADLSAGDNFGYALAFNAAGDRLAIGAIQDDGAGDALTNSGAVRLFTFGDTSFGAAALAATIGYGYTSGDDIDLAALDAFDQFGSGVSLNAVGNILAVGANRDDGYLNVATDSGAARLFHFNDGSFGGGALAATLGRDYASGDDLDLNLLTGGAEFGLSLALNAAGDRLAAGAFLGGPGSALLLTASTNPLASQLFADNPSSTVNLSRALLNTILSAGTSVTLQASNDITLNAGSGVIADNTGGDGGDLTLQAGRSIHLNASVATDGGDLTLIANERLSNGVVDAHRDAGAAVVTMASGTTLNAGGGAVHISLRDGAGLTHNDGGDINLRTVNAASVLVENLGAGDIILNGAISASAGATPIVLGALNGDFVNLFGAGALNPGAGRFLVFSQNPTDSVLAGLLGAPWYDTAYDPSDPDGAIGGASRFVYTLAPVLTVTANPTSRVYGDPDPAFGYTISGLVGPDTLAGAVQGAPNLATDAALNAGVGAYSVIPTIGSLASAYNYGFTFANAPFQINQRALQVTANPQSRVYGAADPALTYAITGGSLVFGDLLSGALIRAPGDDVGVYAIGQGSLTAGANYALVFVGDQLQITPRPVTVTASAASRPYGDSNPALVFTNTSLGTGAPLAGSLATLATAMSNVGDFAIVQGSLTNANNPNYDITFNGALLTITPRPVAVTAANLARTYGEANPALAFITSSLGAGAPLAGSLATIAAPGSDVGVYAITQGSLTNANNPNYDISFSNGALTITPRPIIITARNVLKNLGAPDPALTFALTSGSLFGADVLTGALIRAPGELFGLYPITRGSLSASGNYFVTFIDGVFTIAGGPSEIAAAISDPGALDAYVTPTAMDFSGPSGRIAALARGESDNDRCEESALGVCVVGQ